eukprot:TRINITY_DN112657_c0_g1_i1.p1 TRINITY_DN112657_c0_g1~~TRINITY_DN112657_c0_g1_i1.p1  ORF type:complete len:423 (+),score=73.11 TRINITY_DN112657_c0_g1_i1:128-1396(+)
MGLLRERSRSPLRPDPVEAEEQHGTIRWYSGRRQIGVLDGDDGRQFLIPVGGAVNGNFVPPTPGGLFHGTRVSYMPLPEQSDPDTSHLRRFQRLPTGQCISVQPLEGISQTGLECGVETRIGGRPANEDRLVANDIFDLGFLAGIFDGHGGSTCVDFASQRLPSALHAAWVARSQELLQQPGGLSALTMRQEEEVIKSCIQEAFSITDSEYLVAARERNLADGSTGLIALLAHGFEADVTLGSIRGCKGGVAKLFVANCGDCRAVLLRGRKALPLSQDHKPERPDEMNRIQKAGGAVIVDQAGVHRVGRKKGDSRLFLSTSRSFGDIELKVPRVLVSAEPELIVHTLEPEDWAVVLACDGVWNTLSDQDVADAVWEAIACNNGGPVEASQLIASRAQAKGETDNVTVLVMKMGWAGIPAAQP